MIAVLLLTLRHRWRRALTLCLLSAFTYGVAVAVPAFLAAADRTMIANELAHATTPEVSVSASETVNLSHGRDRSFESTEPARLSQPWLITTFAVAVNVDTADTPPGADPRATIPQLVFRQNYCAHVRLLRGRCPLTAREVLIGTDLATLLHVDAGGQVPLRWVYLGSQGWIPSPDAMTVSVVGIYRPDSVSDPYWGTEAYFSAGQPSPILAERGTIDALSHAGEVQSVDAVLRPGGLTDATLDRTTQWTSTAARPSDTMVVNTQIPALLTRIHSDRQTIREVLPDIAAALILVGCFVLFLAISHAVADRTVEVGVVRLRGASMPDRWWLAAGESAAPVLAGIPIGLFVGGLLAAGAAAIALPHTGGVVTASGGRLGAATIALIGITVVAAHLRALSAPVTDLLRRIPARLSGWRAATPLTLVAALALVALAQLYLQPGPLTGIMLIAPALIVVTLGLLAGQAVLPAAATVGRWAIARPGHLGLGLGALALARRSGAHLLLAVQVIAVALVGFSAADFTAAREARTDWVALDLGAARVIDTGEVA
ncbi:MAG TPA: FtsX-like permease family protein, partial [Micromonosporaceae bacterium]